MRSPKKAFRFFTKQAQPEHSLVQMTEGSNLLTIINPGTETPTFNIGDQVIVEVGGEAGGGLRGTEGVGGHIDALVDNPVYYFQEDVPLALVAIVTNVAGSVLTLDTPASTDTFGARIFLDSTPVIQALLDAVHGPGWTVTFPAGNFYVSDYLDATHTGWTLTGAGKGVTNFIQPKGAPLCGFTLFGDDWIIQDFSVVGNHDTEQFGVKLISPVESAYPVGIWMFGGDNCIIRRCSFEDVFRKAVWGEGTTDITISDCDMVLNVPLVTYLAQWYFGCSDSFGGLIERCTFTCPKLAQAFETFRSDGVSFVDCTSVNGSFSSNSSGNWLLENFTATVQAQTYVSQASFSYINNFIDINSNIFPPDASTETGGIVRNIDFTCEGYIDNLDSPHGNLQFVPNFIKCIGISFANPNILIDGGTIRYPDFINLGCEVGPFAIYSLSSAENVVAQDVTVTGAAYLAAPGNIDIIGVGAAAIDCVADFIIINGVVQRDFATWNPADKGPDVVLSGSNLVGGLTLLPSGWNIGRATLGKTSGKWYWENLVTFNGGSANLVLLGVALLAATPLNTYIGSSAGGANKSVAMQSGSSGATLIDPAIFSSSFGGTFTVADGDVFGFAFDAVTGKIYIHRNGTYLNSGTEIWTLLSPASAAVFPAFAMVDERITVTANFGETSLAYTPPSGFNSGLYN